MQSPAWKASHAMWHSMCLQQPRTQRAAHTVTHLLPLPVEAPTPTHLSATSAGNTRPIIIVDVAPVRSNAAQMFGTNTEPT